MKYGISFMFHVARGIIELCRSSSNVSFGLDAAFCRESGESRPGYTYLRAEHSERQKSLENVLRYVFAVVSQYPTTQSSPLPSLLHLRLERLQQRLFTGGSRLQSPILVTLK